MLTVAIPLYKSASLYFLPFGSIIKQEDAPDFEIIICQEYQGSVNQDDVEEFASNLRIRQPNFKGLKNIILDRWVALGEKWKMIAAIAKGTHMVLTPGDAWMNPNRLRETEELKNNDWIHNNKGYFYSVLHNRFILYDRSTTNNPRIKTGLNIAVRTSCVRSIKNMNIVRGNDGHLLTNGGIKSIKVNESESWKKDLHVHAFDMLSNQRTAMFHKPQNPYFFTSEKPDIPEGVLDRLKQLKKKEFCNQ